MAFPKINHTIFEINTGSGSVETWSRIGAGITSITKSTNENLEQTQYMTDDGWGSSDVVGAQLIFSVSGHRELQDTAQNYIFNTAHQYALGTVRRTTFRAYDSTTLMGITGSCTITITDAGSGDAGNKESIGFEIHVNGKPETITVTEG